MLHEITIQQAAERANQASVTLLMLSKVIDDMEFCVIETAVVMANNLIASVSAWLIEEQAQREVRHA